MFGTRNHQDKKKTKHKKETLCENEQRKKKQTMETVVIALLVVLGILAVAALVISIVALVQEEDSKSGDDSGEPSTLDVPLVLPSLMPSEVKKDEVVYPIYDCNTDAFGWTQEASQLGASQEQAFNSSLSSSAEHFDMNQKMVKLSERVMLTSALLEAKEKILSGYLAQDQQTPLVSIRNDSDSDSQLSPSIAAVGPNRVLMCGYEDGKTNFQLSVETYDLETGIWASGGAIQTAGVADNITDTAIQLVNIAQSGDTITGFFASAVAPETKVDAVVTLYTVEGDVVTIPNLPVILRSPDASDYIKSGSMTSTKVRDNVGIVGYNYYDDDAKTQHSLDLQVVEESGGTISAEAPVTLTAPGGFTVDEHSRFTLRYMEDGTVLVLLLPDPSAQHMYMKLLVVAEDKTIDENADWVELKDEEGQWVLVQNWSTQELSSGALQVVAQRSNGLLPPTSFTTVFELTVSASGALEVDFAEQQPPDNFNSDGADGFMLYSYVGVDECQIFQFAPNSSNNPTAFVWNPFEGQSQMAALAQNDAQFRDLIKGVFISFVGRVETAETPTFTVTGSPLEVSTGVFELVITPQLKYVFSKNPSA